MIRYAESADGIHPEQLDGFFHGWPSPPSRPRGGERPDPA